MLPLPLSTQECPLQMCAVMLMSGDIAKLPLSQSHSSSLLSNCSTAPVLATALLSWHWKPSENSSMRHLAPDGRPTKCHTCLRLAAVSSQADPHCKGTVLGACCFLDSFKGTLGLCLVRDFVIGTTSVFSQGREQGSTGAWRK